MKLTIDLAIAAGCFLLLAASVRPASAATTLNVNPIKDNTLIYASNPGAQLSNGASQFIFAGRTMQDTGPVGTTSLRRGLVAFDISSISPGSTVQSASLTLYFDRAPDSNRFPVSVNRLTADWGEGISNSGGTGSGGGGAGGAAATQNDATWLYRFYNSASPSSSPAWSSPGGDGNYLSTPSATVSIPGQMTAVVPYTWGGAGIISDVQFWIDHPGSDVGWIVKGDETTPGTIRRFESRENSNNGTAGAIDARPVLSITYTPEPFGPAALIVAAAPLLRRQRR